MENLEGNFERFQNSLNKFSSVEAARRVLQEMILLEK